MLSPDEVLAQSKSAFGQWEGQWREHAKINGEKYKKDGRTQQDLLFVGKGKSLLCVANGESLERKIDIIKKYKTDAVDVACCDKALKNLLDNGIKPQYCFVADANINYKEWLEPYIEKTEDIILLASICANPEWTLNWKGPVFFYVNKDNIESEKIFADISGCHEFVPAASNVGNSTVVISVQLFSYVEYFLVGYDFCWRDQGNYYAFGDSTKRYWMKHAHGVDVNGDIINTSQNLIFSSRWLSDYFLNMANRVSLKLYNCSGQGILNVPAANLETKLKNARTRPITEEEKTEIVNKRMKRLVITPEQGSEKLKEALSTLLVTQVIVKYLPDMGVVHGT